MSNTDNDPIASANWWQTAWFTVTVFVGLSAIVAAYMVFRAGNTYQDAVRTEANTKIAGQELRIAELNNETQALKTEAESEKTKRAESDAKIAELTAETAKAKEETAKSNERIARLNVEVETAKADALQAKEGIANAEARSLEASAEVARLNVIVANAEERRAVAEKALLELQEKAKDRHLTLDQRSKLLESLSNKEKGKLTVQCAVSGDPEPCNFAREFASVFIDAGWQVHLVTSGVRDPPPTDRGVNLWVNVKPNTSIKAPPGTGSIISAFESVNIKLDLLSRKSVNEGQIVLFVGFKPQI